METAIISTPVGFIEIKGDEAGIVSILFFDKAQPTSETPQLLKECIDQLQEYFAGKRREFSIKINPQGTEFQKKVWNELRKIPYGTTITYKELAIRLGDVLCIRAAGTANGKNKINIIIPCHRVIGSDGSLTGYGGGLPRKRFLLQYEGENTNVGLFEND
jgi:methylated-DNA-[protein]-cysteine S-methyltransferase